MWVALLSHDRCHKTYFFTVALFTLNETNSLFLLQNKNSLIRTISPSCRHLTTFSLTVIVGNYKRSSRVPSRPGWELKAKENDRQNFDILGCRCYNPSVVDIKNVTSKPSLYFTVLYRSAERDWAQGASKVLAAKIIATHGVLTTTLASSCSPDGSSLLM